ncbi:MAG: hypothetical protein JWO42_3919 [Chloroflexi bacterium]|jgi:uncharacterized protein YxjI|nr:hypothetical protein [Chloroflexota bacterium]
MRYIMREKLFALGDDFTVQDAQGQDRYIVDGKVFSIGHKLIFREMSGNEVATVHQKVLSLRPTYEITRDRTELAEVRKSFLTFLHERFTVDIPGPDDYNVTGSILEHEYTFERRGKTVARVSKAWVALRDTYGVKVEPGEDDVLILASTVVIDMVNEDQRHRNN